MNHLGDINTTMTTIGSALRDLYTHSGKDLDELFGTMITTNDVRIILIGQDSYNDISKVTAMAFSYPQGMDATDSCLQLILAAIKGKDDHNTVINKYPGYLGPWRDQGVLMVNSDYPRINELLKTIVNENPGVCALFIGEKAAKKFDDLFAVSFQWNHPSRKSVLNNDPSDPRHWNHVDIFWKANDYLIQCNKCPINWLSVAGHNTLWIFTDGGYSAKQKKGSAGFAIFNSLQCYIGSWCKISKDYLTNNVAECSAIIKALEIVKDYKIGKIRIFSDSEYCVKTINIWFDDWVRNRKLHEKKNVELFKYAVELFKSNKKVKLTHVRGHQPEPAANASAIEHFMYMGNDYVDRLVNFSNN